jgi:sulfide:quinone oxidoreductase
VEVVIASLPYRCPPAPYGLAMRLQRRAQRLGRPIALRLRTPEAHPLAALGRSLGDALLEALAEAGVEVELGFRLDPEALEAGELAGEQGALEPAALRIVIPTHRRSPLLAGLGGTTALVPVDERLKAAPGVFVAGDAAATPYPRAADPAAVSGTVAAEAVLCELGLAPPAPLRVPEPDCFLDHGEGRYARIRVSYPDGPPPKGQPTVVVDPASPQRALEFEQAHLRWQALRSEPGHDETRPSR